MSGRLKVGFLGVVILSALVVLGLYAYLSLSDAATRFPQPHQLSVAGQLEASRNIALALGLLFAAITRDRRLVALMLMTVGFVELGDTAVGVGLKQLGGILSPLLSGILYLAAAAWMAISSRSGGPGAVAPPG